MLEVQGIVDIFVDSRIRETEDLLRDRYCKTLPHTFCYAVTTVLKAVMTADRYFVDAAVDALNNTIACAEVYRKDKSLIGSFTGFVLSGGRSAKDGANFKDMTRLQRIAELFIYDATQLKSLMVLLTERNMVGFVRQGLNLRQAYLNFKSAYKFLVNIWKADGPEGLAHNDIDAEFINAVLYSLGNLNLMLSILPDRLVRVFEIMGLGVQRNFALRCLELAAGWPKSASIVIPTAVNKRRTEKVAYEFKLPDGKRITGGIRSFVANLDLYLYHIILSGMIQLPGANVPLAKQQLVASLEKFPNSFLYLYLMSHLLKAETHIDESIDTLNRVIAVQKDWRQLNHACIWEIGLGHASMGRWKEASDCFDTLYNESNWSKAIYLYLKAAFLYMADPESNLSEITEMMKTVPTLLKRVAGKSVPMEKFVAMKARKFLAQGNKLLLPGYEIIYMWNGFDHIPESRLTVILAEIDTAIKMLDSQQEAYKKANPDDEKEIPYETFYDDVCLTRFLKGLASRELAFPTHKTLVPEDEMIRISVAPEKKSQLQYAIKQLEYISLQADQISTDTWILPFARYELGQLHMRAGQYDKARVDFKASLNGGIGEDDVGQKRKASMESSLHLRVHNALAKLAILERIAGVEVEEEEEEQVDGEKAQDDVEGDE